MQAPSAIPQNKAPVYCPKIKKTQPYLITKVAKAAFYIFTLPISATYSGLSSLVSYIAAIPEEIQYSGDPKERHRHLCKKVKNQFFKQIQHNKAFTLEPKGTSHLFRPRDTAPSRLDLRRLNRVIEIQSERKIAHVEGCIAFDDFLKETLRWGLRPKVVPELRKITVGGAIAGLAVESSSFKYGLFHETVKSVELLTGTGETVICNSHQHHHLFKALPNSYGTLGYILSAEIELVEAKPFVDLTYCHYNSLNLFFNALEAACMDEDSYEFIDGAIYSSNNMVLVLGKAVDRPSNPCSNYVNEIYYQAIGKKKTDSLTIEDYIWRWDRDLFWSTAKTFLQNPSVRKIVGTSVLRSDRLRELHRFTKNFFLHVIAPFKNSHLKTEELIQDVGVPIDQCANFAEWFLKEIGIAPLFICPIRPEKDPSPLWNFPSKGQIYCDIGFFGGKKAPLDPKLGTFNRIVENKLLEISGKKSLYSRSFYDENTFKELYYGNGEYNRIKKIYDPYHVFLELFEKCVRGR